MSTDAPRTAPPPGKAEETRAQRRVREFHEEGGFGRAYDLRLIRRLAPYVKPEGRLLVASFALLFAVAGVGVLRPLVMGRVVGAAQAGDAAAVARQGLLLAGLVVLTQVFVFFQIYAMQVAGARAMAALRAELFAFMQRLELRYFDRTPVGRLVTRVTGDVDAVGEVFASGVLNALGDVVSLVGFVAMMLVLDWQLALITFASTPVVWLLVRFVRRRSREAFRDIRAKTARLNAFLAEQVSGMAVVQAYARERAMAAEFDDINEAYRDANQRSIFYEAVLDAAIEMVGTVCIASVVFWVGFDHVGGRALAFPVVVTFTQYVKQFFEPVSMLAQRYTLLQAAMSGAERIFQFLDDAPEEATDAASRDAAGEREGEAPVTSPALELDHVDFAYKPDVPVLSDVTLSIARGERVALVGATGAGKTTVTSLLLRLYDATGGAVRVLGRDVRAWDRETLRRSFAVVPQEVYLFTGTVASNVAAGDVVDVERVRAAFRHLGALELFERRPEGVLARVDERGANFSAGERQLIAFARAVYRDAPILVLDEATASVDSQTEARLQVAMARLLEGRTSVVVAHRLSTIRMADRIVVFHKGRIAEQGPHEALLAHGGIYARLHELQFARARLEPAGDDGAPPPAIATASPG